MQAVPIANFSIGPHEPLVFLCGPCVIEGEEHALRCAEALQKMFAPHSFRLIFKASYDKANRSSIYSFRGPGLEEGLRILEKVRSEWGLPVVTDVHSPEEAEIAGSICDMIQIPAFLSRQTDKSRHQCQERAISLSLGHEERRGKTPLRRMPKNCPHRAGRFIWIQQPRQRYAFDPDHAAIWISRLFRRLSLDPAPRRIRGIFRRSKRVHPCLVPRGCRRWMQCPFY